MKLDIEIMTLTDFSKKRPDIYAMRPVNKVITQPHFCKADHYHDVLYGTFVIPEKKDAQLSRNVFSFCLTQQSLYFIDEGSRISKKVRKMEERYGDDFPGPMEFLLDLMEYLIRDDLYILEDYDQFLTRLENELEKGSFSGTDQALSAMRKELNALSAYYMQLSDMGETIEQFILQSGSESERALISLFITRVEQLYNMTRYVKDNLSQVLTMKSEKLTEKQNQLINILTIVTSVFTPLTFITGWFGMNFEHMDILHEPWGYTSCIIFCVALTVLEVILIRRQKVFRK